MRTFVAVLIGLMAAASGVLLLAWLLWRLWTEDREVPPAVIEIEVPDVQGVEAPTEMEAEGPSALAVSEAPTPAVEADDLKAIEGIGPKISQVLRDAGIVTFAQLADTEVDDLQEILEAADPRLGRLADPSTWPDQAALAAEGQWEALGDLQGGLQRGRRA